MIVLTVSIIDRNRFSVFGGTVFEPVLVEEDQFLKKIFVKLYSLTPRQLSQKIISFSR